MSKISGTTRVLEIDGEKKRSVRPTTAKRSHSASPVGNGQRTRSQHIKKKSTERIPSTEISFISAPDSLPTQQTYITPSQHQLRKTELAGKEPVVPQCVVQKMMRILATKKREFMKLRKSLISQQNVLLENYAALRELEIRANVRSNEDTVGDVRVLSVSSWPAHDLLLLVRDDLKMPPKSEISGIFGPQILQQLHAQLNPISEDVLSMGAEIMARRIDLLNILRGKYRSDSVDNLEWKSKNQEFDAETEQLYRMVVGTAENLKAKLNFSLELAKVPWLDREGLIKKIERLQKEILVLQNKIGDFAKKDLEQNSANQLRDGKSSSYQALSEELAKEKSAREALKDVVSTAENMLRVARARIATLERQFKETKAELDVTRRKHKDLEQLYRHREWSYDARSKKLLQDSKTVEITIEGLSRQRDALELRVKELREQAEAAEKSAACRESEQRSRTESLQAKVAEQEKHKKTTDTQVIELEKKVNELEEKLQAMRKSSISLVDMARRCLEYVPLKETEPSDRETEIWTELQVTRVALSRVEEELHQSRADKDSFLASLSRIAQGEDGESYKDKLATELLGREQKIVKLQHVIEDQRKNEKLTEQTMTQYESQLAALRLEVERLRNYDCYAKEIPCQELQTELLELRMQVETLSRERTALVTAAASRALMLERHEHAADLFARTTRARRDLAAFIDGRSEPLAIDAISHAEISRSLSSVCATAADTWTALRAERSRVLHLESAVFAQSIQLERASRVRTQLERRRAMLERELLRAQHFTATLENSALSKNSPTPSLIQNLYI